MKTENELIAEFMGEVITGVTANYKQPVEVFVLPKKPMGRKPGRAIKVGYDTSWDWLMPVVEKILKTTEPITGQGWSYEYKQLADVRLGYPIKSVYQLVVNFIKWHNENKQP